MARAGRCASSRAGTPVGSRPDGSTSSAWTPRRSASRLHCGPATTARCWPRRRPGWPRRRCASAGGRCWRWPSTRPAGRVTPCARCTRRARCSSTELGVEPGPDLVALEQAILRQDPSLVVAAALPEPERRLPVPGSGALRRRRHRRLLRARRRGRGLPGSAGRGRRARGGRTVGQRQVVAGASRRGRRAATQRPPGRGDHARRAPDGRADRAAGRRVRCRCSSSTSARKRSPSARTRPSRRRSSPPSPPTPNAVRWSSPCAPTASASCPPTRSFARLVEPGPAPA